MNNDEKLRIAIIGETGCGKSTLINALLGKIVLPESTMTSTPVLTYIDYLSGGEDYAEIINDDQRVTETLEIDAFIKKYCFNVKEQREVDRKRFRNISHAALHIRSDFLKNGTQLIDTLGFSASSYDTAKTESVLDSRVDLVFYVVAGNMLADYEVEHIQNLLGYRTDWQIKEGREKSKRKTSLSKLFFICNEKQALISDGLTKSICRIFHCNDCDKSAKQIANFAKSHIVIGNFLIGRILNAGIYPYSRFLFYSKEEAEFAITMEKRQKRYVGLSEKDEDYIRWQKVFRTLKRIIGQKRKDIQEQRRGYHPPTVDPAQTEPTTDISGDFNRLLAEANKGSADARILLGLAYEEGDKKLNVPVDHRLAFLWYLRAAVDDDAFGRYCVGTMFEEGKYVPQDDSIAFCLYEKSARQGCAPAQTALGLMFEMGRGIDQSYSIAFYWYTKAAEQNDSNAQLYLGMMYDTGEGVEQSYQTAFYWYSKSAQAGNMYAMLCLGVLYENGTGVAKNDAEAYKWFEKSARLGCSEAKKRIMDRK